MVCKIVVSGGISGNITLANALHGATRKTNGMFYGYILHYANRRDARKAIADAFKSLNSDKQDAHNSMLAKSRDNSFITYDTSNASLSI